MQRGITRRNFIKSFSTVIIGTGLLGRRAFAVEKPKLKCPTAKEVIEKTLKESGDFGQEVSFTKKFRARSLENATLKSNFHEVVNKPFGFGTKAHIHTHPFTELKNPSKEVMENMRLNCLPSNKDLNYFFNHVSLVKEANMPFMHIAVNNEKGEIVGYTTLYATKAFAKNTVLNPKFEEMKLKHFDKNTVHTRESLLGFFEYLQKQGLKIRQTPMPGYKLTEGVFLKK
ncbi:MAG: hypothetical protein NTY48_04450 [Candidatus Diapherotrites archaeon]|nr:hypothetical protein [Candidatus Diapherotrites archaeon]